jgi:UDPglucose 6-dehydrogenase
VHLAVVGSGYVGLVAGACFAETGNDVVCVDKDAGKIERLLRSEIPIYEPGLEDLVRRNQAEGRLRFSTDLPAAVREAGVIFIAVGTPPNEDGSADLSHVLDVAGEIGRAMNGPKVIVNKYSKSLFGASLSANEAKELLRNSLAGFVSANEKLVREAIDRGVPTTAIKTRNSLVTDLAKIIGK